MKVSRNLEFATIEELAGLLAARKVSPVELAELFLERIERHNPRLNAFLTVTADAARGAARRAEKQFSRRGRSAKRHPLLGIPFALKDNIWTRGIRTTAGTRVSRDFVPSEDATAVSRLGRAGAILLGKTNLHEFAYGITNNNPHYGPCRNPWATERISGGSSGGSAVATAAGLCVAALGSDTGGSVRIPSAMCAVVGLKPTFGRVSVHGTVPLSPTFDHVGPIARSVTDVAILLGAIAGRDPLDSTCSLRPVEDYRGALRKPMRTIRLGRLREYFWDKVDDQVRAAVESAIRSMEKRGARIREVSVPHMNDSVDASVAISLAEARRGHEAAGYYPARSGEDGEEVRKRIEAGAGVRAIDYLAGLEAQKRVRAEMDSALSEVDAIVAPTVPVPAPLIGAEQVRIGGEDIDVRAALVGMNRPANFTGHPAISVPCGFTREGLPVGLQLIGRAFDEATLLRVALAYERVHPWASRHPAVG